MKTQRAVFLARAIGCAIAIFSFSSFAATAASSTGSARIGEHFRVVPAADGRNEVTLVGNGLNYQDTNGAWIPSIPVVQKFPNAIVCTGASYRVILATNLNSYGSVDLELPADSTTSKRGRMVSHPLGLAFYDPDSGATVLLAQLKDCSAQIDSNKVIFADAFVHSNGIQGSITYTYGVGHFHQDVTLTTKPTVTPSDFGMGPNARLEMLTQFEQSPEPEIIEHKVRQGAGLATRGKAHAKDAPPLKDETLNYGTMQMGKGKAFSTTATPPLNALTVTKQLVRVGNQKILTEDVPWDQAAETLQSLPASTSSPRTEASARSAVPRESMIAQLSALPPPMRIETNTFNQRLAEVQRSKPLEVAAVHSEPPSGFVLDYELVQSGSSFNFQSGHTYLISDYTSISYVTIQSGAVIKYSGGELAPTYHIDCPSSEPKAVLTDMNDDSVGETISGSVGHYNGSHAYVGLDLSQLDQTGSPSYGAYILNLDFRFFNYVGVVAPEIDPNWCYVYNCWFFSCGYMGAYGTGSALGVYNCDFCDVATPYPDGTSAWGNTTCAVDRNGNGLPDSWEFTYLGGFGYLSSDVDASGNTLLYDYQHNIAPTCLSITAQPTAQTVFAGQNVTFTVSAVGLPSLSYQWKFNGVAISGATAATYTKNNVQAADAGNYSVTVANRTCSVNSGNAALSVLPPVPQITDCQPFSGGPGLSVAISGINFSPIPANNVVYFGPVRGTVTSASATGLTVTVPTGASLATISVTVGGLTGYSARQFLPAFPGVGTLSASSLGSRVDIATGTGPQCVVAADIDGDGKPDLIVANASGATVSVFRNISTVGSLTGASFAAPVNLSMGTTTSGTTPYAVALADVDGDGKLDIIALGADHNVVSIFRNISSAGTITTASFAARIDLAAGNTMRGVTVQDLNGDGKPEIITANYGDSNVSVYKNNSSPGTISFASRINFSSGSGTVTVAVGDFDGDGKPDIAAVNYSAATISIFRNLGTSDITSGSFAPKVDFAAPATPQPICVGDLDQDGKLDLVVGGNSSSKTIAVYRNTSTSGVINSSSFAAAVNFAAPGWVNGVAIGDLDGDGKVDIALITQIGNSFSVFKNVSTPGSFTTSSLAARVDYSAGSNPNGLAIVDLDGDGRPDIAFGNFYANTLSLYRNIVPETPTITSQPADVTVSLGGNATFTVAVSSFDSVTYQWFYANGQPVNNSGTHITGATTGNLNISGVLNTDAGGYYVRISDGPASVTSSTATLTVYDSDQDGLPDWWEMKYFGNLNQTATGDYDGDGNNNLWEYQHGVDPNKVQFSITPPALYVATSTPQLTLTVIAGVPSQLAIQVDNANHSQATWAAYSSTPTVNLGSVQGWHTVYIGLRGLPIDAQQTWQQVNLYLDTVNPIISITSPANNVSVNTATINVFGNFTETSLKQITVNGVPAFINGSTYEALNVPLSAGANTVTATATDFAGRTGTATITVTGSATPVVPVQLAATPIAGFNPLNVTFTVTANVPGTIQQVSYDFDGDGVYESSPNNLNPVTHSYSAGQYFPVVTIQTTVGRFSSLGGWNSSDPNRLRINVQTPPVTVGTPISITDPVDLKCDAAGNLYVLSRSTATIKEYNPGGTTVLRSLSAIGNTPRGLDVDSAGNVYVAVSGDNQVLKFIPTSSSFQLDATFGVSGHVGKNDKSVGTGNGEFNSPFDVAVSPDGTEIAVSDSGNNRIQRFSINGSFMSSFGQQGAGTGQFNAPKGLTYDGIGKLYIVDSGNNRLVLAYGTDFLGTSGSFGSALGQFQGPVNLGLGTSGIYVGDSGNNRIEIFDLPGSGFNARIALANEFTPALSQPNAATAVSDLLLEKLYIADTGNNRVLLVQLPADTPEGVWNAMKQRLLAGDIAGAIPYFASSAGEDYRQLYLTFSASELNSLISQIPAISPIFIEGDKAQYYFQQPVAGVTITFPIDFVKENGLWKILEY